VFSSVLVANRGEIAVRIVRTCRELGIRAVAVHSEPDADALHVRLADEAAPLQGTSAAETYLDVELIVKAAVDHGCDAVHPGYGFLAENAALAEALHAAGIAFVGPPPSAIAVMGEKVAARAVARRADVPQVPGTQGAVDSADEVLEFGAEHGYPLLIKASYGGGGRGMRTVDGPEQVAEALAAAQREARGAFGRADVYVERYLPAARHVEVQIFADQVGNTVWLGDRDCSVQRRHQKVVEEAPAPGLSDGLRRRMGEASVRLAQAVGYEGAGTVEFLVEVERDAFYFLEMNTRIQVEHPVTEEVLGLDLIAEQLSVASGEPLSIRTSGPSPRGHAIEVRLNAEDVSGGEFRPSPGPVHVLDVPDRPGVRLDAGYESGDVVPPYYDSLIGKLIVWAPTRDHAIRRMLQTLDGLVVSGVPTTAPAARAVLEHPDFQAARINTLWLETTVDLSELHSAAPAEGPGPGGEPAADEAADRQDVWVAGRRYVIPYLGGHVGSPVAAVGPAGTATRSPRQRSAGGGRRDPRAATRGSGTVTSPMQGTVVAVEVAEGQTVVVGELLVVMEAMKMENPVRATVAGTVRALSVTVGQVVPAGTVLVEIEPDAATGSSND
jgi:acetyl-CoA/propionyl-CoA carboxylase biotin carboxyl carrier protein